MFKVFIFIFLLLFTADAKRTDIGQHAFVRIVENDLVYLGRIDSGARITSLNAINIKLEGNKSFIYLKNHKPVQKHPFSRKIKNQDYKHNIGRMISFDTINEQGEKRHMREKVVGVARVRNAQGTEYRYVVVLGLKYNNIVKYKEVNLRDRSNMTYKLLIGRNWLDHDFAIKTDKGLIKK
jgi:hypothetical protein